MVRVHLSPPLFPTVKKARRALYLDNCIRRLITRQKRRQTRIFYKVLQFEVLIYWHRQRASLKDLKDLLIKNVFWIRDVKKKNHSFRTAEMLIQRIGQVTKSAGRMPWHRSSMKDVTSCDKLRGVAHTLRSADFRMGEPGYVKRVFSIK